MQFIHIYKRIKSKFFKLRPKALLRLGKISHGFIDHTMQFLFYLFLHVGLLLAGELKALHPPIYNGRDFFAPSVNRENAKSNVIGQAVIFLNAFLFKSKLIKTVSRKSRRQ